MIQSSMLDVRCSTFIFPFPSRFCGEPKKKPALRYKNLYQSAGLMLSVSATGLISALPRFQRSPRQSGKSPLFRDVAETYRQNRTGCFRNLINVVFILTKFKTICQAFLCVYLSFLVSNSRLRLSQNSDNIKHIFYFTHPFSPSEKQIRTLYRVSRPVSAFQLSRPS